MTLSDLYLYVLTEEYRNARTLTNMFGFEWMEPMESLVEMGLVRMHGAQYLEFAAERRWNFDLDWQDWNDSIGRRGADATAGGLLPAGPSQMRGVRQAASF